MKHEKNVLCEIYRIFKISTRYNSIIQGHIELLFCQS